MIKLSLIMTLLFTTSLFANAEDLYFDLKSDFDTNPYFSNENVNLKRDNITSPYVLDGASSDYIYKNARPLLQEQIELLPESNFLDKDIFEKAYSGYLKIKSQKSIKSSILTVVDYTKKDTYKRLFVLDLEKKKVLFNTWTQHGYGTDKNRSGIAQEFSNTSNSNMTSLGFFLTSHTYSGMWGYSMRIKGIDSTLNSKAFQRAVVVHSAGSLTPESSIWGNMGLSAGCITLPFYESGRFYGLADKSLNELIINTIKNNTVIFSYYYNLESKWID